MNWTAPHKIRADTFNDQAVLAKKGLDIQWALLYYWYYSEWASLYRSLIKPQYRNCTTGRQPKNVNFCHINFIVIYFNIPFDAHLFAEYHQGQMNIVNNIISSNVWLWNILTAINITFALLVQICNTWWPDHGHKNMSYMRR